MKPGFSRLLIAVLFASTVAERSAPAGEDAVFASRRLQLAISLDAVVSRLVDTAKGTDRVRSAVPFCAAVVDDAAKRRALYERFVVSQEIAQIDPWAERVAGKEAHEFAPIRQLDLAEAAE